MSYCEFTKDLKQNHLDKKYHDFYYGYPVESDDELFGRLILEINQAGLNWSLILNKEENFRKAFDNFSIASVAQFDEQKITELMNNKGIIRNRRKIEAVIFNAKKILIIQEKFGSFNNWLTQYVGFSLKEWTKLFKKNFKFTGEKIVEEFLMSTGYVKGAHDKNCPVYDEILKCNPQWKRNA
ncbi:DNA-3-methyladenine glycosylase [Brumimicrobium salinarum]|uniref:DNA-3-methyladenine glycosylase n=1 Tax=Brumimicrobium salinarum TaxID=2058658 RepID=A0A2I0R2J7_9FLAO|nr:DNA-3-methyladenine glycosylase I [Brumimicrobium salinarum]PKR80802.1 DNA-3-methyladenine glycosylase [Brumimicrobium salinarum]